MVEEFSEIDTSVTEEIYRYVSKILLNLAPCANPSYKSVKSS